MGIDKWISPSQEIGLRRESTSATILQTGRENVGTRSSCKAQNVVQVGQI